VFETYSALEALLPPTSCSCKHECFGDTSAITTNAFPTETSFTYCTINDGATSKRKQFNVVQ